MMRSTSSNLLNLIRSSLLLLHYLSATAKGFIISPALTLSRDLARYYKHDDNVLCSIVRCPHCVKLANSVNENNPISVECDNNPTIDRQSNKSKYGRGITHLSADLIEGNAIAYQDGTWYVDGSEVGDGSGPIVKYAIVDTIQIVWTHDCEHGFIRGFEIMVENGNENGQHEKVQNEGSGGGDFGTGALVAKGSNFVITSEYIQLGPEQLLARLPTLTSLQKDGDVEREAVVSLVEFDPHSEIITT